MRVAGIALASRGLVRRNVSLGDRTTLRLGGDIKVRVQQQSDAHPVSLAVGGGIGVETGDNLSVLSFSPTVTASRTFKLGQSGGIIPYARAGLGFSKLTIGDFSDTDFALPIRLGSDFRLSTGLDLVLEMQINFGDRLNDNLALVGGVNLPF